MILNKTPAPTQCTVLACSWALAGYLITEAPGLQAQSTLLMFLVSLHS